MLKMNQYLKIKQASEFLGVSISKMIKMDHDGILVAHRMPGSQYRLYTREQLEIFLRGIQAVKTKSFDEYAKTRLTEKDLQEIKREAHAEFKKIILKK